MAAAARWHDLTVQQVATALATDLGSGLPSSEAARRLAVHGPNALSETRERSIVSIFAAQLASPLIYMLAAAAVIAVVLGHRGDAIVIGCAVLINTLIGTLQESRAARSLRALRAMAPQTSHVIRDGRDLTIESRDLVPGDVLVVEAGVSVTADARLIDEARLQVAEAALTGESLPVVKHVDRVSTDTSLADRTDMIYSATHVTAGRGRAVVVETGAGTEIGRIAMLAEHVEQPQTPLEQRVARFGRQVIVASLVLFALIVGVGVARGMTIGDILLVGISQLVGMIPEGLPVAMTVALAVGVQRMARRRAIVRQLGAVESLGSTTVICSDKTGTLTRNELRVAAVVLPDGRELAIPGGLDGTSRELLEACTLCNDAQLGATQFGDPTEIALLLVAESGGVSPAETRARFPRTAERPFDPATRLMATEHRRDGGRFVVIKGAPEVVIEACACDRPAMNAASTALAARALRVLAVAIVDDATLDDDFHGRARLLGLVGEIDLPRPEVAEAVAKCRAAGIRTVMVTGDHATTGLAIARTLGIASGNDVAVDGRQLDGMSEAELADRISSISVFARVEPAHKLRIVTALQARGEVVAMTGDGVNDAPALVRADVGVAMGGSGTEVAKEASKIVIADDNFATIVSAVEEGRVVYGNIKKAILLLFSTSAAEVVVLVVAMLLGYPAPFAAVQILWNNLVTEGLITVNLVLEPPEGNEMQRQPVARDESLLTRGLLTRFAVMVPTIATCTLGWFIARTAAGVPSAQVQTESFTLLAICEWFNVLNCRSETRSALSWSIFKNPWLVGGLVIGNLLQVAAVFWRPLGDVIHTVPFDMTIVLALAAVGSLVLWVEEVRKLVSRRRAQAALPI